MRVPYSFNPPPASGPEETAIVDAVLQRRGTRGLQPLDLAMMHSLPLAEGWNTFYGNIRTRTSIAADVREVAICRVAVLTRAYYEWPHHAPIARSAGVAEPAIQGLKDGSLAGLSDKLQAVARYAQAMTEQIEVPEETFEELRKFFSPREIVEITMVVSAYNCTSRFLVALNVGESNGVPVAEWK